MNLKNKKLALAISLAFSTPVMAQTVSLPTVVVTANPVIEEVRIDRFSATSAVVTQDQIRDLNAVDLAAALRTTPGVQISRYDPVGSYNGNQGGAIYIRGMGASRPGSEIKTYVDGIPVYMGVWNHPLLDLLPVNAMDSITVFKSPQPQTNGNNFASVDLKTKRATEEGVHGSFSASAGSFGTNVQQGELSVKKDNIDAMFAIGHAKSNGQRANADGELKNFMGSVNARINQNWTVGASVIAVDNVTHDPGSNLLLAPAVAARNDSNMQMITAYAAHQHDKWSGEIRVYSNSGDNDLYKDQTWGTFLSHFNMSGLRWKEQFSPWEGGTVVVGLDHDTVSGKVSGPMTGGVVTMPDFRVSSPYLAVSQSVNVSKDWTLVPSIGLRHYSHNQFKSQSAPFGGISLVSDKVTVFANFSRGVVYPGMEAPGIQAALPILFAGTTWPQLSPQTNDHQEIGVQWAASEATQIDLSLFRDSIKNRYVYNLSFGSGTFYNFGNYQTTGLELSIKQHLSTDWKAFAGLTLLNSNLSSLPYAPKNALTIGINGKIGPVNAVIDAQYQSKMLTRTLDRNALNTTTEEVGAFATVNTRLSYPLPSLGKKGEVFIAGENLFNRKYAYQAGYPMPGINGRIGVTASF